MCTARNQKDVPCGRWQESPLPTPAQFISEGTTCLIMIDDDDDENSTNVNTLENVYDAAIMTKSLHKLT